MKTESLGMNIDQLLVINGPTVSSEHQAEKNFTFKNQLKTFHLYRNKLLPTMYQAGI